VSLNDNNQIWPAGSFVQGFYDQNNKWLRVRWNGTVTASVTYYVSYICL